MMTACEHDSLVDINQDQQNNEYEGKDHSDEEDDDNEEDDDDSSPQNPSDSTQTEIVYYSSDIQPILDANCAYSGCHNPASHADGYDFSEYSTTIKAIRKGNAGGSRLYKVLVKTSGDRMPPSPLDRLPTDQINLIAAWINQGAENN